MRSYFESTSPVCPVGMSLTEGTMNCRMMRVVHLQFLQTN